MIEPSGRPPTRIWGLERIAITLGISRSKLVRLLDRPAGERPPVRHCHRGWYALESRLRDWVDAEDMDGGVFLAVSGGARDGQCETTTCADAEE